MAAVLEWVFLAWLIFTLWGLWRGPVHAVLFGLLAHVVMFFISTMAYSGLLGLGEAFHLTGLTWSVGLVVLSVVIYLVGVPLCKRWTQKHWGHRFDQEQGSLWIKYSVCGLLSVFLGLLVCLVLDALVPLYVLVGPKQEAQIKQTVLLSWFMDPVPASHRPADSASVGVGDQDKLLSGLQKTFRQGTGFLARATGTQYLKDQMKRVADLTALPYEEKTWLVQNTGPLVFLMEHPQIKGVMEDQDLLSTILKASGGSLSDIQKLMSNPKLAGLEKDPKIWQSIKSVDLQKMETRLERRRAWGPTVLLTWTLTDARGGRTTFPEGREKFNLKQALRPLKLACRLLGGQVRTVELKAIAPKAARFYFAGEKLPVVFRKQRWWVSFEVPHTGGVLEMRLPDEGPAALGAAIAVVEK